MLPTNDGLTCIVGGWTDQVSDSIRRPTEAYRKVMESVPRMAEFLASAKQVEPVTGMREQPGYLRQAWGNDWALAGAANSRTRLQTTSEGGTRRSRPCTKARASAPVCSRSRQRY